MNQMDRTRTIWLGIDPGKEGCLAAVVDVDARTVPLTIVPFSEEAYVSTLRELAPEDHTVKCVLEHVWAMPRQGVTSMFNFGENFGFIRGLLAAFRIPYELVRPQKWKRVFGCTSDKHTSITMARNLFPGVDLRRTPKCTKPHDGVAEALLMAEYARRTMG